MQICQSILAKMHSRVFLTRTRQDLIEPSSSLGLHQQLNHFPVASSHFTSTVIQNTEEAQLYGYKTGTLTRSTKSKSGCFFQGCKNLKALSNRERPPQRSSFKVKGKMVFSQSIFKKHKQKCVFSQPEQSNFFCGFCKPDFPFPTHPY